MSMFNKSVVPLVTIFLVTAGLILVFRNILQQHGFDWHVMSGGNLLIYAVTVLSMHFLSKGLTASTTAGFLQHTYSSILLKLFVVAIAAFIYLYTAKGHISKRALLACMALYILYTFVERRIILKHSKEKKNEEGASAAGVS